MADQNSNINSSSVIKKEGMMTYSYILLYIALSSGRIFFNKMADQNSNINSSSVIKKEGMMTYSYILLYIALSSGQIFFNKMADQNSNINSSSVIKKEGMMTYSYILLYIALSSGQIFFNKMADQNSNINSSSVIKKEGMMTYSYILLYIALSSGQIFFNKWVLSSKEINFPYPLGLTLLHMMFSSVLCFVLTKVLKILKVEEGMTLEIYTTSVIPIGAMFAMTLWLGNTAYLYISVSFAQMLKAVMPVAVFILGVAAGLEVMSMRMLLIMSVISFGVLVASYGEININWIGVVYQMGGVVGEALRLIFMEILVKRKGLKLNPISMMYYVSPCSALCLLIPWIFLEKPKMDAQGTWSFQPLVLILNSLCTFALNLSVFLVIQHTSALTIRVAGVVKDWVVVLLSALLFADTKLTLINIFGYAIAIGGVAAYNNFKLKKEATRAAIPDHPNSSASSPNTSIPTAFSPKTSTQ